MGSGHGVCGAHSRCTCYANWQGYDCSERTCAYAKAWVDVAFDNEKAHDYAECSNRGLCDRKSGECKCFDGYTVMHAVESHAQKIAVVMVHAKLLLNLVLKQKLHH